jgi:flavin reductase (DIM6/NTAB) family NADH-FMN oxidoreductase RutF/rubredoxin
MKYKAFHKLSYGLYIITTRVNDENAGYIGNTVFQVTSEPSQIAISCHKKNATLEKILQSKVFSISVLGKNASTSLIGEFGFMSGTDIDKFRNLETKTAKTGVQIVVDSSVAWFDCKVVATQDVGSHVLIIGEVLDSDVLSDEEPLTYAYYREKYKMLSPKNSPTYIEKEKLVEEEETPDKKQEPKPQEKKQEKEDSMDTFTCQICGYQYNPDEGDPTAGIPPGTPFEELPDDYKCPICNASKEYFKRN